MLTIERYRRAARLVAVVVLLTAAVLPQLALGQPAEIAPQAEKLLRRDGGPTRVGVQQGEAGREVLQGLIHHGPDRPEGMILRDPLLRLDVAPHVVLLSILSAHPAPPCC